jgi:tetratricopeptide (TPR) repeat protein
MKKLLPFLVLLLLPAFGIAQEPAHQQYGPPPDSVFLVLKAKHSEAVKRNDRHATGIYLQQMGELCYRLGHYAQALNFHLQAGDIFRKTNEPKLEADNLAQLGILYYYMRQPSVARRQYDAAMNLYVSLKDTAGIALIDGKLGHLYEKQRNYDSAFYFQRRALSLYLQSHNEAGMAKIYENLGSIYEDLERYDSAQYYFTNAAALYSNGNNREASIEVLNNIGDVSRKSGRYREALQHTFKALALANELHDTYQVSSAWRDIARTYNMMGRNDSAYYYLELSRKAQQEIYSEENGKQMAFVQVLYDVERKNHEIEKLQIARRATAITTIAVVVVIILIVVVCMLIISRQRLKIRNERALSEQNKNIYEKNKDLMQAELLNKKLLEEQLTQQLELKSKELSTHTLHIIQKNQLLEDLCNRLEELVKEDKRDQKKQLKQLIQQITQNFNHEQYWKEFHHIFEQVHQSFYDRLKDHCSDLTSNDIRLVALLKMNLSSDNIATLLGISPDSLRVSRYRLRKKLGLEQGENLSTFLQTL